MTSLSEHPAPSISRWQIFTAAPHRVMFFGGALNVVAAMLWWLIDLSTRYGMVGHAIGWPVAPNAVHAYLLVYGLFPFFMFGFLLTTFPRWMAGKEISARRYVPAFVLLMLGAAFFYIGLFSNKMVLALSVMLTLCGWAIACHALLRVLLDTSHHDKRHPIVALITLVAGWCGAASYLVWLLNGQVAWLKFSLQAGIWLFLLPEFATIGHRMIPFFSSSALPQCRITNANWPWWVILASSVSHGLLQLAGAFSWLWLCDAPLAASALYLSYAWNLRRSLAMPILAVPHIGFAWLGIAALLFTAQSFILLLNHGEHSLLGLAPLHALTIGCFSTLLLGMATRVTLAHAGFSINIGKRPIFLLLAGIQAAVLLRILADILPIQWSPGLYLAAATAWLACFLPWVITHLPIYLRPRPDGRPG